MSQNTDDATAHLARALQLATEAETIADNASATVADSMISMRAAVVSLLGELTDMRQAMLTEHASAGGELDLIKDGLSALDMRISLLESKVALLIAGVPDDPPAPDPTPDPIPTPVPDPVPTPTPLPPPPGAIPMPPATTAPEWHGRDHSGAGSYDMYIPPGGPVRAILSWSTNALSYSADDWSRPDVNAWAKRNRVAILTYVNYPADHMQTAAIDAALTDLAQQSHHPELRTVPWMARGFSQAGYRAWHIIKNCQDRGLAFSWYSGSPLPIGTEPSAHPVGVDPTWADDIFTLDANDANLFGLFLVGSLDSDRRKHTLAYVEGQNGAHDAQWDYAEEPGAIHDYEAIHSQEIDLIFFEEVLNHTVWPTPRYVAALNKFKRAEFPLEGVAPTPVPVPTEPPTTLPPLPATGEWLAVTGKSLTVNGAPWVGMGVNVHDCRSCDACEGVAVADMQAELQRRTTEVADVWGGTFVRLLLEDDGRHIPYERDDAYRQSIRAQVAHAGSKGLRVLVSLWDWPGLLAADGTPTDAAVASWAAITADLATQAHVLFGICNEPENNYGGADDDRRIGQYRKCLKAIRDTEAALRVPHHVVVLQALGGWSSVWGKLLTTDMGDAQIAYEAHQYSHPSAWQAETWGPAATKPVIVGEFGPAGGGYMTNAESQDFIAQCKTHQVHWLAWTFHMRCAPNLLVDNSGGGCGRGMQLVPTAWGQIVKAGLVR